MAACAGVGNQKGIRANKTTDAFGNALGESIAGALKPVDNRALLNAANQKADPDYYAAQGGGRLNLSYRDDDPLPESGWVRIDGDGPLDNADRDVSSGQSYGDFLGAHGYQRSNADYRPGENDGSLFVAGRLRPRSVPTGPVTPLQPGLDGAPPSNSTPGIGSYLSDFWDDVKRTLNWSTPNAESTGTGATYKNKELTVEEYQYAQARLESQRAEAYSNRMRIADKWDRYILANPGNAPEQNLIHVTPIEPGKDKGSNVLIYPVEEVNGMLIMGNPITTPGKFDNVIVTPRPEIKGPSIMMSGRTDEFNFLVNGHNGILSTLSDKGIVDFKINAVGSPIRGGDMFDKMMNHYGDNVKGIRGNWMNLDKSESNKNLGIINKLTSQGVPLKDAVMKTWTAAQAIRYGYTESKIQTDYVKGDSGNYTKVEVIFTKPKK